MARVVGSKLRPAGRPVTAQVYGATPPVTDSVWLYVSPTRFTALAGAVSVGGLTTVKVTAPVLLRFAWSVTVAVVLVTAAVVGVPVIMPDGAIDRPAGSAAMVQVFGS